MPYQLTPEHAKLWLPVVRELREYYEGKNDKFKEKCPLCKVAASIRQEKYYDRYGDVFSSPGSKCRYCLWLLFEKEHCDSDRADELRMHRNPFWCECSIFRLKRWERELKKIIKEKNQ